MLPNLTYELSVLAKAVQHKNLSAAAVHIGLSQPQLSRLISKIEGELKIVLLDRTARRKSGWTPLAQELAITFSKGMGRLEMEITSLAEEREISELRIGTLEGLQEMACNFTKQCFDKLGMKVIYLDVLDFRDLDSTFLSGELDLIFSVRAPSKQKYSHMLEVGYQQMEDVTTNKDYYICSPFEFTGLEKKSGSGPTHAVVSNSLSIRSKWLHEIGGSGVLPIDAKKGRGKGHYSIYLIGSELLSPKLWSRIEKEII